MEDLYEDYEENTLESCPRCDLTFDEIDFEFQACSKCGYDCEKGSVDHSSIRNPTSADIDYGDYDLLNGRWM